LPWCLQARGPLSINSAMLPKKLVETIELKNGLFLKLYDCSRRVAGDRWYIGLLAEVEVPVTYSDLEVLGGKRQDIQSFLEETQGTVVFQMKEERNFIDERERGEIFDGLLLALKSSCIGYMGHKAFAFGLIRKRFQEHIEKKSWWREPYDQGGSV